MVSLYHAESCTGRECCSIPFIWLFCWQVFLSFMSWRLPPHWTHAKMPYWRRAWSFWPALHPFVSGIRYLGFELPCALHGPTCSHRFVWDRVRHSPIVLVVMTLGMIEDCDDCTHTFVQAHNMILSYCKGSRCPGIALSPNTLALLIVGFLVGVAVSC